MDDLMNEKLDIHFTDGQAITVSADGVVFVDQENLVRYIQFKPGLTYVFTDNVCWIKAKGAAK